METLESTIREFYYWQHSNSDSFYSSLISIYHSKADRSNREKLYKAYPNLYIVYIMWINASDNGNDLFRDYGFMPHKEESI